MFVLIRVTKLKIILGNIQDIVQVPPENNSNTVKKVIFIRRKVTKKPKTTVKLLTRKRKRNEENWIDVQAKRSRAEGKEGIGRKGLIVARSLREGCDKASSIKGCDQDRCKKECCQSKECCFKCHSKINHEERQNALKLYLGLGDKKKQWECINNWVYPKENAITSDDEFANRENSKQITYRYNLPTATDMTRVCRKMFLDTLGKYIIVNVNY